MKTLRFPAKTVALTALIALLVGMVPQAQAQTTQPFLDTNTNLRTIRSQPNSFDPSTGAPQASNGVSADPNTGVVGYVGNPGCNSSVLAATGTSANYSYTQHVAVYVNTLQQPLSLSNCLQGLINDTGSYNAFLSGSITFSALIQPMVQKYLTNIVNKLQSEACSAANDVTKRFTSHGANGAISLNFGNLKTGGVAIQADFGASGSSSNNGFVTP